ncbi:MAG: DNA polymerase I [Erysipelotrichaceae bacterium]|nr:DNA polymerase I [Erysipelotrichaceae bacterium]
MKKLLLIDGNSMLFRAYFATAYGRPMSTSSGIPTNAIFGFASMLHKALEVIAPDFVVVAFDHDKKNFRREIYPQYKGTRQKTPDNLVAQFPIIREYLDAIDMTQYEQHGIEADDIIGSLAKQKTDYDINVLTSDRDLLQIVDDRIKVWLMVKGITEMDLMDPQAIMDKYQLKPLQIIDLKGLAGDTSDNIPGVTKVGDKTAIKLLNDYGTVEGVYEHIDEIKGKLQENLIKDHEIALLSKQLATIKIDADIDIDITKCDYDLYGENAMKFYSKYEMRSFLKNVTVAEPETKKEEPAVMKKVRKFDNDMLSDDMAMHLNNRGIGLSDGRHSYYITIADAVKDPVFTDWLNKNTEKTVHNVKHWYHVLDQYGLTVKGNINDTMIQAFLVDGKIKNLEALLLKYHLTVTAGSDQNRQIALFEEEDGDESDYLCQLAANLLKVKETLKKELAVYGMTSLYREIELPLAEVLFDMEKTGVRVDAGVLDRIARETSVKIAALEQEIYQLANRQFNINSPKQLAEVIYDDLALMRSTKRSTDASVLKKIEDRHPIIPAILEYRKYAKLNSTYAIGLKKYIQDDSKIHTEFNQCIAETGRLSSSNPNLQNISVRNEEAQMIRAAFIPEPGCVFVGADYSQVELRILAHLADEKGLIDAFKAGMDIHTRTAMDVFNVPEEEVTPLLRRQAKAINFGIDYGMSDFGLAERLEIPVYKAKEFIESYFRKYPNVRRFMDQTIAQCREDGYVTTMLNRRRDIPEIKSSNHSLREFGKRAAMNAPVQGSAADLIKIAMINVYNRINREGLKSKMILQIHDELILNVPKEEEKIIMKLVEEEMENAMELKVPLLAESESGNNWLEVK